MSLESIYYIGQTFAVLAILVSLAYVAFQTRQNTKVTRAKAAWDAQNSFVEINETLAAGGTVGDLTYKAVNDVSNLSDYEKYRMHRYMRGVFQRVEAQYALFTNGILDEEVWQLRRRYIRGLMNVPLIAEIWQADKTNFMFTEAFVHEMDSAPDTDRPVFLGTEASSAPDLQETADDH